MVAESLTKTWHKRWRQWVRVFFEWVLLGRVLMTMARKYDLKVQEVEATGKYKI
jgi:hypothetical protein